MVPYLIIWRLPDAVDNVLFNGASRMLVIIERLL